MAKFDIPRLDGESPEDFRRRYHREWERLTRLAKGLPVRGPKMTCSADGCDKTASCKGLCRLHYQKDWKAKNPDKSNLRDHPLYSIWWERKDRGSLCPEWASSFQLFLDGVGDRPSIDHLLRPLRWEELYGPDNFEWMAALKRAPGESTKDFNARKWQSRRDRDPTYESGRGLKRKYGVTPEMYADMLGKQGGVCRICGQPETKQHHKTAAPRSLAVDHCRETKKVRGLLCGRCNLTIGGAEHSIPLLEAMIQYLRDTEAVSTPPLAEPHKMIIDTPWGKLTVLDAAKRAGLKPRTVVARIRHGHPENTWLAPLKKSRNATGIGDVI